MKEMLLTNLVLSCASPMSEEKQKNSIKKKTPTVGLLHEWMIIDCSCYSLSSVEFSLHVLGSKDLIEQQKSVEAGVLLKVLGSGY